MRTSAAMIMMLIFCFCLTENADAQQRRPCGPSSLKGPFRYLIPQGAAGANFRSACARHDACYATTGSDKDQCDLQFLHDLNAACRCSRNPRKCRRRAQMFYKSVVKWGDGAFDSAQQLGQQHCGR